MLWVLIQKEMEFEKCDIKWILFTNILIPVLMQNYKFLGS